MPTLPPVIKEEDIPRPTPDNPGEGIDVRSTRGAAAFARTSGAVAVGVVPDLVDSVLASGANLVPGVEFERGTITSQVPLARSNRGAVEIASGVAGVAADAFVGSKVTAVRAFDRLVETNKVARAILASDRQVESALKKVRRVDRAIATQTGLGGKDALRASANIGGTSIARTDVARAARVTAAKRTLAQSVATEALIAGTLNENEFAVPDHAATTMMTMAGLGLVIPQPLDQIAVGAMMRRGLQSTEVRFARAATLDAGTGIDALREESSKKAFGVRSGGRTPDDTIKFRYQHSDAAAVEGLQLRGREATPRTERVASARAEAARGNLKAAQQELSKVTTFGTTGSGNGFTMSSKDRPEVQTLIDLIRNDPVALQGLDEIGDLRSGLEETINRRNQVLDAQEIAANKILFDPTAEVEEVTKAQRLLDQVQLKRSEIPVVIENGELLPAEHFANRGAAWDRVIKPAPGKRAKGLNPNAKVRPDFVAPQTKIRIVGETGEVVLPQGKSWKDLTFQESESAFALGRKFIQSSATKRKLLVDKGSDWFHLDMAEVMLRERPDSVDIVFDGITREEAQVRSFAQKAALIRAQAADITEDNMATYRQKFNLPPLTESMRLEVGVGGTTPAEALVFSGMTPKEIRALTLTDLKEAMRNRIQKSGTLAEIGPEDLDPLGISFKESGLSPFQRSRGDAREVAPVLAFRKPLGESILDRAAIFNRRVEDLSLTVGSLTGETSTHTVRQLATAMLDGIDSKIITDLSRLDDTLNVNSSGIGIRRGVFSPQNVGAAGNPAILAAQRIYRMANSFAEQDFDNFMRTTLAPGTNKSLSESLGNILRSDQTKSRLLFEQFAQARRGFSLSGNTRVANDGKIEFLLRDTEANRIQYRAVTGNDMPRNAVLPLNNGAPLGVDDAAMSTILAFDSIADKLRLDRNAVLRASGLREINKEAFYIPPPTGTHNGFIFDADNNPVRMIHARNGDQLRRMRSALENNPNSLLRKTPGGVFRSQNEVQQELSMLTRAQTDFLDVSDAFVQSVKGGERSGAGASPFAIGHEVQDMIRYFKSIARNTARDVIETTFQPQIVHARSRAAAAVGREAKSTGGSLVEEAAEPSVANTFLNALLGRKGINSASSTTGKVVHSLENLANAGLRASYGAFVHTGASRLTPGQYKKEFTKAVSELGERTPFTSATQLLEERGLFKTPPEIATLGSSLNDLATRLMLRYDPGHAGINIAGIITTFPAVARSVLPRHGESYAEVADRLGRHADIFTSARTGKAYSTWSVYKEMGNAIRFMLSPKSHPLYEKAKRIGGLDASIAEMHKELGQIHDTATWKTAMRKVDKYISFLSDKSEEMAVNWSFFTAERLLQRIGIDDEAVRISMARQMVDESIANFSPLNRPEIFQSSGIGSIMGLFQTYAFNYFGRLFGYIENRQYRTLGVQYALQAQMFGVNSVPGIKQYNDLVFNLSGGQEDPMTGLYNRLPQPVADAMYYGTPSTIAGIFGLSRDEVPAASSRGAVDIRIPGTVQLPAGLNVVKSITGAVGEGIALFSERNPELSDQQVGEILQRYVMNRPLSAMISMYWTDALVDPTGNKVAEETASGLGMLWRTMGFRTVAQASQLEAHARFRGAEALRLQRRAQLTKNVKTLMRGGNISDTGLTNTYRQFLLTGGTPEEFLSFVKRSYESATQTEAQRALESQLSNPDKIDSRMANILRLWDATHDANASGE